jgi:lantibiotic leader peptide-processing serine protease
MHRMRNKGMLAMLALLTLALAATTAATTASAGPDASREYIVLYGEGVSAAEGQAAVEAAGGTVADVNTAIGVATVRSDESDFAANAAAQDALEGAAANEAIGQAPDDSLAPRMEFETAVGHATSSGEARHGRGDRAEPLAGRQWDMEMIGATADGSHDEQKGSHAVRVGIIDTGIDGSHPDIAPNFDAALSRNFTTDDPTVDGACVDDPDGSCEDPSNVDEYGHGTHVAGTVGAAVNDFGIAGVAPRVKLVNLRAGQDSGYFFLPASLNALTYAGDIGIDVVNMSYYIDPWLYNCRANPADSPAEQREQQVVIDATQRALDYARERGVTLVASAGNGSTDKGKPVSDASSPNYPGGTERPRQIDNSCKTMPSEGDGVIGVTALAPSKRKSYYSDYGLEQADVSAPGGDTRDGNSPTSNPLNAVLSPWPEQPLRDAGLIDAAGNPVNASVVKECDDNGNCAYYRYAQGTSMASPHAAGVAALAVAEAGRRDRRGGVGMPPARVERLLLRTATDTPCPAQNPYVYPVPAGIPPALCEGNADRNGFYGDGIVDAERIVDAADRDGGRDRDSDSD